MSSRSFKQQRRARFGDRAAASDSCIVRLPLGELQIQMVANLHNQLASSSGREKRTTKTQGEFIALGDRARRRKGGGLKNLLPSATSKSKAPPHHRLTDGLIGERCLYDVDLGTLTRGGLCPRGTSGADFRRILEAPPGFEPGMEVLQI